MGLAERQKIKQLQTEAVPEASKAIQDAAKGGQIKWDIDWASLEGSAAALSYFNSEGLGRVVSAVTAICASAIGQEAVRNGLKTIAMKNVASKAQHKVSFENGTLSVSSAWGESEFPDELQLQRVLENGL